MGMDERIKRENPTCGVQGMNIWNWKYAVIMMDSEF
jgi:hypothetical protein